MSFDRLLNETATIMRLDGETDRYGNVTKTYEEVEGGEIAIRIDWDNGSEEEIDTASTVTPARGWTRSDQIKASDILEVGDVRWEVVGEPQRRQNASGAHHYELTLKKVTA